MKKLTLVSIIFRGRRLSRFVILPVDERGKVAVAHSYIEQMALDAGAIRGNTYTHG